MALVCIDTSRSACSRLVVAIGAYTIKSHPVQYASSGTVVFVAPDTIAQREARNDKFVDHASQSVLARFSSLTVVGDIFSRTYQSWGKHTALEQQGLRGRLFVSTRTDVSSDTPDHGPVIVFEVLAADPLAARDGVRIGDRRLARRARQVAAGRGSDPVGHRHDHCLAGARGARQREQVAFSSGVCRVRSVVGVAGGTDRSSATFSSTAFLADRLTARLVPGIGRGNQHVERHRAGDVFI